MKSFNEFCEKYLDRLYDPNFSYKEQCSGYKQLRLMVEKDIVPATKGDENRWENNPTVKELYSIPETKYMRNLHPLLRDYVRNNWETIKKLEL